MLKLGDLVKTVSMLKTDNFITGYEYSCYGDEKLNIKKIITGKRSVVPVGLIGIILGEFGTGNNRWFLVHFASEFLTCWISPVWLQVFNSG